MPLIGPIYTVSSTKFSIYGALCKKMEDIASRRWPIHPSQRRGTHFWSPVTALHGQCLRLRRVLFCSMFKQHGVLPNHNLNVFLVAKKMMIRQLSLIVGFFIISLEYNSVIMIRQNHHLLVSAIRRYHGQN